MMMILQECIFHLMFQVMKIINRFIRISNLEVNYRSFYYIFIYIFCLLYHIQYSRKEKFRQLFSFQKIFVQYEQLLHLPLQHWNHTNS